MIYHVTKSNDIPTMKPCFSTFAFSKKSQRLHFSTESLKRETQAMHCQNGVCGNFSTEYIPIWKRLNNMFVHTR